MENEVVRDPAKRVQLRQKVQEEQILTLSAFAAPSWMMGIKG